MTTFHSELWCAIWLGIGGVWFFLKNRSCLIIPKLALVFFVVALIPWLQYGFGQIYSFGVAWQNSIYLAGFALMIVLGSNWEAAASDEALDFLFFAIIISAVVSVGMQLNQLSKLFDGDIWVLSGYAGRFSANLHQPNLLGSLLLMAVVGVARAYGNGKLGPRVSIFLVVYFLLGVALTESRTAVLNIFVLFVLFYKFWPDNKPVTLNRVVLLIFLVALVLVFSVPILRGLSRGAEVVLREVGDSARVNIWRETLHVLAQKLLFGYGWGGAKEAYLVFGHYQGPGGHLSHAHNIFLDLLMYNGVFFGSVIIYFVINFFFCSFSAIKARGVLFPLAAATILMLHACLELPLHHAFFLLPLGLILGVIGQRVGADSVIALDYRSGIVAISVLLFSLVLTLHDCLEVERTIYMVRYDRNKQPAFSGRDQPTLYVLTQWKDRFVLLNADPEVPLSEDRYRWMRNVVLTTPSPYMYFRFAEILALNNQGERVGYWLNILCRTLPVESRKDLAELWGELTGGAYKSIPWGGCPNAIDRAIP
ncbi:MAG: Wzy polymerase domain-containing protein [Rhodocyclales bacterium]|nr:Wzy polymerase domain-containing protein [Rhodocyclales bacterium]